MGLLSWLTWKSSAEQNKFCSNTFPELWNSFVDNVIDSGFSGQACATPAEAGVEGKELPTQVPLDPSKRLVAVGDLHGDLGKARRVFRLAGLTDEKDRWVGGQTVCVQVGDVLDRGDAELQILYFLERLQAEAKQAGGSLYLLNGNHETMNVMGNHRYATSGATREIHRWQQWQQLAERLRSHCGCSTSSSSSSSSSPAKAAGYPASPPAGLQAMQAAGAYGASHFTRTFALQPGSTITKRFFANHPTVLQVGETVFVHGGVLPQHVEYGLDKINRETREWMRGGSAGGPPPGPKGNSAPDFLRGADAIVWARDYSAEDAAKCDCAKLEEALRGIPGAERMVMGHTIQDVGVNAACGGRALRVDVGMSRGCGDGDVEALEIQGQGQQMRLLRLREGLPPEELTQTLRQQQQPQEQQQAQQTSSRQPVAVSLWSRATAAAAAVAAGETRSRA